MAEKTTNYQCPACTGPLHYDGASGKLVCDYCGSAYDVKDIEARYAKKQAAADTAAEGDAKKAARLPRQDSPVWSEAEAEGLNSYSCPTCGAELVCDETTAATTCPYCGNPTVLGGKPSCPRRSRARTTSRRSRAYMFPSGSTMPRPTRAAGTRARTPRATARAITW